MAPFSLFLIRGIHCLHNYEFAKIYQVTFFLLVYTEWVGEKEEPSSLIF